MFAVLIYFWKLQMSFLSPLSPEKILAFFDLIGSVTSPVTPAWDLNLANCSHLTTSYLKTNMEIFKGRQIFHVSYLDIWISVFYYFLFEVIYANWNETTYSHV